MSDSVDKDTIKISKWLIGVLATLGVAIIGQIFVSARWAERIEQKQEFMALSLAEFKQEVKDGATNRYTAAQAVADHAALMKLYDAVTRRVDVTEQRIRELEQKSWKP